MLFLLEKNLVLAGQRRTPIKSRYSRGAQMPSSAGKPSEGDEVAGQFGPTSFVEIAGITDAILNIEVFALGSLARDGDQLGRDPGTNHRGPRCARAREVEPVPVPRSRMCSPGCDSSRSTQCSIKSPTPRLT
jgi:hypothetical protein